MSVRKRFLFSIGTNVVRSALGFLTGILTARWLGPRSFGEMAFLSATFAAAPQLLDLGSSSAFFTFLSQRPRSRRFLTSFFLWQGAQLAVTFLLIALAAPERWVGALWPGEPRGLVVLAFAAMFLENGMWPAVQQAGESQRMTVLVQTWTVAIQAADMAALIVFWRTGWLSPHTLFFAVIVEHVVAGAFIYQSLLRQAPASSAEADPGLRHYFDYCLPFVVYTAASFAYTFLDRWMLQSFGGGVQQAYYAVAAQLSSGALLATASILRIFWKEIAEAHHRGDVEREAALYKKVSRLTYLIAALVAGFFMPWAREILMLTLGPAYAGGSAAFAVMLLYPVHQSLGQICGTMLYATERSALQVKLGLAFILFSGAATYFALAPSTAAIPGLGLASFGMAVKMVGTTIVTTNITAYVIARIMRRPWDWRFQPISLAGCLGLGFAARSLVVGAAGGLPAVVQLAAACAVYLPGALLFVYAVPGLTGLSRAELSSAAKGWLAAVRLRQVATSI